jgi:hypothetical protein
MQALTPASADDLPPLGQLIVDEPFWRYPEGDSAREGVAHLRVWTTLTAPPGYLAVVTVTGSAASVTNSAACIWAELTGVYGSSLVLLEHDPGDQASPRESLDLVHIGRDGRANWGRVWPTDEDGPRHAGLEAWMAAYGRQMVTMAATTGPHQRRRPAPPGSAESGGSQCARS